MEANETGADLSQSAPTPKPLAALRISMIMLPTWAAAALPTTSNEGLTAPNPYAIVR
jgi:hypothetical protein